jgi:hypothetical protein
MNNIAELIYKSYEQNIEAPRLHLGCSMLGERCDRRIWLNFRNAVNQNFSGRILKLFKFGHDYEDTAIQELKAIGCKINSRQTRVDFGSHVSGSCDGIILGGLPGHENKTLLLEIKTSADKHFKELLKKGMKEAKPTHYIQMCCYGYGLQLNYGLYYAVNKNTSEIYTEVVKLDFDVAKKAIERGQKIALSDYLPEPISADSSWFECKMCSYHQFCFETHLTDSVSCRTCALSTANANSTFTCSKYDDYKIEAEYQRTGCEGHVLHPELTPWQRMESDNPHEAVYIIDNQFVRNGEPDERVYSSKEIIADPVACAHPDDTTEALRVVFDARLVDKNSVNPTF